MNFFVAAEGSLLFLSLGATALVVATWGRKKPLVQSIPPVGDLSFVDAITCEGCGAFFQGFEYPAHVRPDEFRLALRAARVRDAAKAKGWTCEAPTDPFARDLCAVCSSVHETKEVSG